ncbi:MAG: hypothetical protein H0U27_02690 [Nitrosopumilus sp.]|nr:hypothetical protein [Nitrosopumilus sp.]
MIFLTHKKLLPGVVMDSSSFTLEDLKDLDNPGATYNVCISPHLQERLERHILILKRFIDRSATKQRWITEAIKEKLSNYANNPIVSKELRLYLRIEEELEKKVLEKVEYIKKFRSSYSKKQWIMEAIFEKLDRDESDAEKKIQEAQQTQQIRADTVKQMNQFQTELELL